MKCTLLVRSLALGLAITMLIGCAGGASTADPRVEAMRAEAGPLHDPSSEVSPSTRRKIVVLGYQLLKVGMTRDEVRAKMGPPDVAAALFTKQEPKQFMGWSFRYFVAGDGVISLYFDPAQHRLLRGMVSGISDLKPLGLQPASPR